MEIGTIGPILNLVGDLGSGGMVILALWLMLRHFMPRDGGKK